MFFKPHPKTRFIYAVTTGQFAGELFVFIKANKEYEFLSLPLMCNRKVPKDKFQYGINQKIVDVVSKIPRYVYEICKKQFIKNEIDNETYKEQHLKNKIDENLNS